MTIFTKIAVAVYAIFLPRSIILKSVAVFSWSLVTPTTSNAKHLKIDVHFLSICGDDCYVMYRYTDNPIGLSITSNGNDVPLTKVGKAVIHPELPGDLVGSVHGIPLPSIGFTTFSYDLTKYFELGPNIAYDVTARVSLFEEGQDVRHFVLRGRHD